VGAVPEEASNCSAAGSAEAEGPALQLLQASGQESKQLFGYRRQSQCRDLDCQALHSKPCGTDVAVSHELYHRDGSPRCSAT